MDMSTVYEEGGRTRQKARTRSALVEAARELVAQGKAPTVEEAAEAASISRTTAYRYFPNQLLLLAAAHPETAPESHVPPDDLDDPAARLAYVVRAFVATIAMTEAQQRTMLRLSLEESSGERPELPLRQGRAIGWLKEALEPLRPELGEDVVHRLALAIRSAAGIEALVWLTDVAGLSTEEAGALMRWSAQAMFEAVRAGNIPPLGPPATRKSRRG